MTISWSFPYNSIVNFHVKIGLTWKLQHYHVISNSMLLGDML